MTFKIKNLHDAALKDLHSGGHYKPYDRQNARNEAIDRHLYRLTANGAIKGFYLDSQPDENGYQAFRAYHRSPKNPGQIQLSVGWIKNGELIPTYDIQYASPEDFTSPYKREMHAGIYKIID